MADINLLYGTCTGGGTQGFTNPTNVNIQPHQSPHNAMAFHAPTGAVVMVVDQSTYVWSGTDWLPHPSSVPNGQYPLQGGLGNVAMAHDPVLGQTVLYVGTRYPGGGSSAVRPPVWRRR